MQRGKALLQSSTIAAGGNQSRRQGTAVERNDERASGGLIVFAHRQALAILDILYARRTLRREVGQEIDAAPLAFEPEAALGEAHGEDGSVRLTGAVLTCHALHVGAKGAQERVLQRLGIERAGDELGIPLVEQAEH